MFVATNLTQNQQTTGPIVVSLLVGRDSELVRDLTSRIGALYGVKLTNTSYCTDIEAAVQFAAALIPVRLSEYVNLPVGVEGRVPDPCPDDVCAAWTRAVTAQVKLRSAVVGTKSWQGPLAAEYNSALTALKSLIER